MAKGDGKLILRMITIDYKYGEMILENLPEKGKYVSKQKNKYGVIIIDISTNDIYFRRIFKSEDYITKDFAIECFRLGIFIEEELFEILL